MKLQQTPGNGQPKLVPLAGSEKAEAKGFSSAAAPKCDKDEQITVTVVLRRRAEPSGADVSGAQPMTSAELAEKFGADPADLHRVHEVFAGLGFTVAGADAARRTVQLTGPVSAAERAFGTDLCKHTTDQGTFRHRSGGLSIPAELEGIVVGVLGLDDRPQTRSLHRIIPAAERSTSYKPTDLGAVYQFPPGADGSGTSVAIIELGGGFTDADLDAYFTEIGVNRPTVTAVNVDGAQNAPSGDANGPDGEVMLDIEVVGGLAPASAINVYFAPNTDAGFLNAITTASHATTAPTAMSISWGQQEDGWTEQARNAMENAFVDAALLGVSVSAASGDNGSSDGATDGKAHVDFPAASPHVLACGGTRLEASSGSVSQETVWNNGQGKGATGGGVSRHFPLPEWQKQASVPAIDGYAGRGVPDVAAVADPQTGYQVRVDGTDTVIGGTSAVAPLWAALLACVNQAAHRQGKGLGLIQPALAAAAGSATGKGTRDITEGDNGDYQAKAGWDPCTGWGVPVGTDLLTVLAGKGKTA